MNDDLQNIAKGNNKKPLKMWTDVINFVHSMYRKCQTPNVVHAVATSNSKERAQKFLDSLTIPEKEEIKAYGSYEELLADPNCEINYIAIVNQAHCLWTLAALASGKHVLCEKPMGLSSAETRLMAKSAREKGLFLMDGFWSRCFPVYQKLGAILDQNLLGAVKTIGAHFGLMLDPSRFRPDLFETPIMNLGIYTVQFAMFCMGDVEPSLIRAEVVKSAEGCCDSSGNIYLEFDGGKAKASLMWTSEADCPNSAFVAFEKGIVQIPDWFYCPTRIRIIKGKPFGDQMDTEEQWFPLQDDPGLYPFPNASGLCYEIDHVNECLERGLKESPLMSLNSSIRLSSVMDEIRRQIGVVFPEEEEEDDSSK